MMDSMSTEAAPEAPTQRTPKRGKQRSYDARERELEQKLEKVREKKRIRNAKLSKDPIQKKLAAARNALTWVISQGTLKENQDLVAMVAGIDARLFPKPAADAPTAPTNAESSLPGFE